MQIVRKKRIPGRENPSRTFEGLSDFANLFTMFLISVVAVFALYVLVILVANLVSPKTVRNMDRKMTEAAVNALMSGKNYENVISLMELNHEYLHDGSNDMKLGECYENIGEYSSALKYYLDGWEKLHSPEILDSYEQNDREGRLFVLTEYLTARLLCHTYIKMGDFTRAEEFLAEMKRTYSDSLMTSSEDLIEGMGIPTNQMTHLQIGPLKDEAIICYQSDPAGAIEKMRTATTRMLREDKINVNSKLSCLDQLIGWEIEQGRTLSALSDIHRAVDVARKAWTVNDFEHLGELADYCKWAGENEVYDELMPLYRRYLKHYKRLDKPEAVRLVRYMVSKGRLFDAERRLVAICEDVRSRIENNLLLMSDDQREFYIKTVEEPFSYAEELLVEHPSPGLAELVASNMLFKKGLLLRSNRNQRIALESSDDPHMLEMYDELIISKKELAALKAVNRPDYVIRIASLQKRIYSLDKSLTEACSDYLGDEALQSSCSIEGLQDALDRKDSFIYFAHNRKDELFALHIGKKGEVKYYRLGNKADSDENIYRSPDMLYGSTQAYDRLISSVPLPENGKGIAYYTTSGIFNQISFPAIMMPGGRNLMDDVNMRMVSDPSSISHMTDIHMSYGSISLWGGIRYSENLQDGDTGLHRAIRRGEHLVYLRGSREEVERISSIMSGVTDQCNLFTSYDATEASFKSRDGQHDEIIHISTHGFFNEDAAHYDTYDMMANSGLFFAGSDKYWAPDSAYVAMPEDGNDGILRSSEIELMDLNGCSLVVLSACETGLGYDDSSEGVYGLQRAFKLAGADKILMSLWEVPDEETALLMETFYRNLQSGDEANDALKKAQVSVRQKYPSPESWGGFVLLN